ncbi:MFS transporter [Actinomycetaceae bacterium WB03_NA08]|uniref:MFS transporter n=1 Tax=Scrofimicrobium canadense TaxID=2652290 RepID=A0A6N7W674_9ACTO|nr:MFS transporter [Scrofimicrobium canadense]MSS83736.1 MFS transporter [Scrofimicrobium canadense]
MSETTRKSTDLRRWIALAVLMLPVLLVSIDGTVVNLALPMISLEFSSSGTLLLWIIDAYSLVLAGLLVTMGSLADRFGRRRMLLIGASGFALMSVGAAFSPTGLTLVFFRAALGFFGAMLMPATLSIIRNMFTDRSERRLALAIWAASFSAGAALGPVVGGILLQYFSWHSVFLIAVPLLVPMLILTPIFVPESKDPQPGPVSILNVVLSMATLTPAVYAIKTIATEGFTPLSVGALVVALIAGVWFVYRQLHSTAPMLDIRLFSSRFFSGSVLTNLFIVFSMVGFLYYASQHLQLVERLDPIHAGLTLLPGTVVMMVSGIGVVSVAKRVPVNRIISVSVLIAAISFGLLAAFGVGASPLLVGGVFALLALGTGPAETLTNDAIVSAVPAHKAGAASAISETAYEVGAVLGTAVLGTASVATYRSNVALPQGLSPAQRLEAGETLGGAVSVADTLPAADANSLLASAYQAFDLGVVAIGVMGAVIMGIAAVASWILLRRPKTQ